MHYNLLFNFTDTIATVFFLVAASIIYLNKVYKCGIHVWKDFVLIYTPLKHEIVL